MFTITCLVDKHCLRLHRKQIYTNNQKKPQIKKMTQIERLNEELKNIKPNVSFNDKVEFSKKEAVHVNTVSNYLGGEAKDADIAVKMLKFFAKKIAARNKVLESIKATA